MNPNRSDLSPSDQRKERLSTSGGRENRFPENPAPWRRSDGGRPRSDKAHRQEAFAGTRKHFGSSAGRQERMSMLTAFHLERKERGLFSNHPHQSFFLASDGETPPRIRSWPKPDCRIHPICGLIATPPLTRPLADSNERYSWSPDRSCAVAIFGNHFGGVGGTFFDGNQIFERSVWEWVLCGETMFPGSQYGNDSPPLRDPQRFVRCLAHEMARASVECPNRNRFHVSNVTHSNKKSTAMAVA